MCIARYETPFFMSAFRIIEVSASQGVRSIRFLRKTIGTSQKCPVNRGVQVHIEGLHCIYKN